MPRLFDPHIHMYSRTTNDYEAMSKAGVEVIVQPSFWLGSPRRFVGTFEDYWENIISFEPLRAKEFGIEYYSCISVNPKEAGERPLALDAVEAMVKNGYLERDGVVAVGEIGYDQINELEEEIFVKQMDIASERHMLMTIHLPHKNKLKGVQNIERIMNDNSDSNKVRYNSKKMLIDHNVDETIGKTLEMGMWAGLSVYPVTKLSPDQAIKILNKYGTEHVMIHSAADWGRSDPLSVPKVAKKMKESGRFSENEIEKVTFSNAVEFFKQSPRFTWRP